MKAIPALLIILDGFSYRADLSNNAIVIAHTPNWDKLRQTCSNTLINASGITVELPDGQMGNSEVGPMNIGAGRVVYHEYTGILAATIKAVETLDLCIGRVVAAMQNICGEVLTTADHGNAETMMDESSRQPYTAHTTNPVPFLYVGRSARLADTGALDDVAPTLLKIMGLSQPSEIIGHSLIEFESP